MNIILRGKSLCMSFFEFWSAEVNLIIVAKTFQSESVPLHMFDILSIVHQPCIHWREQIGTVKITTHSFNKVCDASTLAAVKSSGSGNANGAIL